MQNEIKMFWVVTTADYTDLTNRVFLAEDEANEYADELQKREGSAPSRVCEVHMASELFAAAPFAKKRTFSRARTSPVYTEGLVRIERV